MIDALRFTFSTQIGPPPASSQVRLDAAAAIDATALYFDYSTDDGIDAYHALMRMPLGAELFVQDVTDHTQHAQFRLTMGPYDRGGYVEIGVQAIEAAGAPLGNNQDVLVVVPTAAPIVVVVPPGPIVPPLPPATRVEPLWLTYDEAIGQLQRGAEEDRPRVEATMGEACAVVLDYLDVRGNPQWTPDTVPLPVKAATKLTLTHLYEHRGDDSRLDEAFWQALGRILARVSDVAIA